ncbi:MAG: DNA polymerase III subunit delta [Clostridiales bacterium]|jgi:DNA polymerase-3 subunit delta|nr:DNA polymerase III subunit delta [Clostridiales bacterium]
MPEIDIKALKTDIKNGGFSPAYLFYGEESYLREHYLSMFTEAVVGDRFPEFNIRTFSETLPVNDFIEACDSFPMMSDKRLVIVRDFDIFKADEDTKNRIEGFLQSPPEHCVVLFYYGKTGFAPDRRTKFYKAFLGKAKIVCFRHAGKTELIPWIKRRFAALGKLIDTGLCEYLIFLCGDLMQDLIPEIEKIAAYSKRNEIKRSDIDAVAAPKPSAIVFNLTDALRESNFKKAVSIAEQLKESGEKPIPMLAMIAKQFRQLYLAKLTGSADELMGAWNMEFYRARRIVESARSMRLDWIKYAIMLCAETDLRLKTASSEDELEVMIARLAAYGDEGHAQN